MSEEQKPRRAVEVKIDVDCTGLDLATEKANRLVDLLTEVSTIIDSLAAGLRSEA